jgi:hypothetical protein
MYFSLTAHPARSWTLSAVIGRKNPMSQYPPGSVTSTQFCPHAALKAQSQNVNAIICNGDFVMPFWGRIAPEI